MSGYLKKFLQVKSMVTNGNEGWRTAGTYGAPPPPPRPPRSATPLRGIRVVHLLVDGIRVFSMAKRYLPQQTGVRTCQGMMQQWLTICACWPLQTHMLQ